jgi:hypothetical protein
MADSTRRFDAFLTHPTLGLVAPLAARADSIDRSDQSVWQYGAYSAAHSLDRVRAGIQAILAPGVLAVVALAYPHFWLWRLLLGMTAGLVVYLLIPVVWMVIAAISVAPVKQRNAAKNERDEVRKRLKDSGQRVRLSLNLRQRADLMADEYVNLQQWSMMVHPTAKAQFELGSWIEGFKKQTEVCATILAEGGLTDEAERFRVQTGADGRLIPPAAIDHKSLESLIDLLNVLTQYRASLAKLAYEQVHDQP